MLNWLPINTAPRDGTPILVRRKTLHRDTFDYQIVSWQKFSEWAKDMEFWRIYDTTCPFGRPKEWQPLEKPSLDFIPDNP